MLNYKKQFGHLKELFDINKFHHCYVFIGEADCGQAYTITEISRYIFCRAADKPCGECPVCKRVSENSFSDIRVTDALITLEKTPKIDEIRDIISWAYTSPMEGDHKLVIINNIDKLNIRAANLLLKTIEEPPQKTFFILSAKDKHSVLPTILSRSMVITFEPIKDYGDDELLALTNGRWELARRLASDAEAVSRLKREASEINTILNSIQENNIATIFAQVSGLLQDKGFDMNIWLNIYETTLLNNKNIDNMVKVKMVDSILSAREQKKSYCRDIAIMDNLLFNTYMAVGFR